MSLPKKFRLRKNAEFRSVFKEGGRLFGKFYVVVYKKNQLNCPRLGVSVSKKVGNAVKRNYEKRIIRDFFKKWMHQILDYDIVIIKNRRVGNYHHKEKDFQRIMRSLSNYEADNNIHDIII